MGIFLAIFNTNFKQSKLFICTLDMQVNYIYFKQKCGAILYLTIKIDQENDLDAKN